MRRWNKSYMIRILYFFVSLILLSSCAYEASLLFPNRPSQEFKEAIAEGSPEFAQGWKDGCEVGMASGSNTFYKMFYRSNAVDGFKMGSSSDYATAWSNAFWYCIRYDSIRQGSSIWSSVFGGYR